MKKPKLYVAFDFHSLDEALPVWEKIKSAAPAVKIGLELFISEGEHAVEYFAKNASGIFLDLKLHDISQTVLRSLEVIQRFPVELCTVHAQNGINCLKRIGEHLENHPYGPKVVGVTHLTSSSAQDFPWRSSLNLAKESLAMAMACKEAGLSGVVCAGDSIEAIKKNCGRDFFTVTPGVRPSGTSMHDQIRITTPSQAVALGSDALVVGRPITEAKEPLKVLKSIEAEMK